MDRLLQDTIKVGPFCGNGFLLYTGLGLCGQCIIVCYGMVLDMDHGIYYVILSETITLLIASQG